VSNLALSDRSGSARFFEGKEGNTGTPSLRQLSDASGFREVTLAPFDSLVEDCSGITLMKVDVEGAELQVSRGMEKLLRTVKPYILVEITDRFLRDMGDSAESLLHYMNKLGYVCYVIDDGKVTPLDKRHAELPWHWNALLAPGRLFGDGQSFSS
jgi:Methyltransferase FkbM domain